MARLGEVAVGRRYRCCRVLREAAKAKGNCPTGSIIITHYRDLQLQRTVAPVQLKRRLLMLDKPASSSACCRKKESGENMSRPQRCLAPPKGFYSLSEQGVCSRKKKGRKAAFVADLRLSEAVEKPAIRWVWPSMAEWCECTSVCFVLTRFRSSEGAASCA